jgi:hypothetical protein
LSHLTSKCIFFAVQLLLLLLRNVTSVSASILLLLLTNSTLLGFQCPKMQASKFTKPIHLSENTTTSDTTSGAGRGKFLIHQLPRYRGATQAHIRKTSKSIKK